MSGDGGGMGVVADCSLGFTQRKARNTRTKLSQWSLLRS